MSTQLKSFSEFLSESAPLKSIAVTFGRFQPPTIGHEKLLNAVAQVAAHNRCGYRIYASQTHDAKKNPLPHASKLKFMREMFPKHARSIVNDDSADNMLKIGHILHEQGFSEMIVVVGDDRVTEFETLLNRYNGEKKDHGFYNFKSIKVLSAGERDPDADGVTGMSSTKMRAAAAANDLTLFTKGVPKNYDATGLFNAVRVGMGLRESTNFRKHVQLESTGELRESYINGDLFAVGDSVVIKENSMVAKVAVLGSNYLVIELAEGQRKRVWLNAVEPLEEKLHSNDSLPFVANQYAPIKREALGLVPKPLSQIYRK
jgi:hypothetical protein